MKGKKHFTVYKIPGGKRIRLGDEESIHAFDSYYPEWETKFYMVPPFLPKRDSLFGEDKGYTGEVEIIQSFLESRISGILISNFSSKDENKILQSKAKATFEIDFIFLAKNFEMWIIEVRKSQPNRIAKSIKEKFEQAISNRNHILSLAHKMFGKQFSEALGKICNCVVAIPDADANDFKNFKYTETWKMFKDKSPCYKVEFINDKCSIIQCISGGKHICMDDLKLMQLKQFYATLTLVKTSLLSFDPEKNLSTSEKKYIWKFTDGMHPNEYHIILSPEQWTILKDLPTHLQIVGEAATGKTELLKAILFRILKYFSIKKELRDPKSKIGTIFRGLEQIVFIIFGDRPYLKDSIENFISQVKCKLNFSQEHKPVVELQMISECCAKDIDIRLAKHLELKCKVLGKTFVLIDECYHKISSPSLLQRLHDCQGCWMTGVLAGQDPLHTGWIPYLSRTSRFQIRPLRRLYRGTKGITMAASTLRLANFSDSPSFLANQCSYIECVDDLKVKDIEDFSGIQDEEDTLVALIKGESSSGDLVLQSTDSRVITEEIRLNDRNIAEDCFYLTKCTGTERSSVVIIIEVPPKEFAVQADVMFTLLSIYTSRALNSCTIYCSRGVQRILQNTLFPKKTVQVIRFGKNSDLPMFSYQEVSSDLEYINPNLNPLTVAAGAGSNNIHLFKKYVADKSPLILQGAFQIMMHNSFRPNMEIVKALLKSMKDINILNDHGQTPLIIAVEQKQSEIVRHLLDSTRDVDAHKSNDDTLVLDAARDESHKTVLHLIKDNVDVNAQDDYGHTALIFAARSGHIEIVQDLIRADAAVNAQNNDGDTALILAANEGHIAIVQDLIKADAAVNAQNNSGNSALILASQNGHIKVVQDLIKADAAVNAQNNYCDSALICSARNGHIEIVQDLIKADVNVNLQNDQMGETALILAAKNGQTENVRYLIKAFADVNAKDNYGNTALICAAQNGHIEILQDLIKANAAVNAQDTAGATALNYSAWNGHNEVVQDLIKADAGINTQDNDGDTALILAAKEGHIDVVQDLVKANASVNIYNNEGATALILAAENGHIEIVQDLIKADADVNAQDNGGGTALIFASQNGHIEIVQDLIKAGATVNTQDNDGDCALVLAAYEGHIEIVYDLIKADANVNLQDSNRSTALNIAAQDGNKQIVDHLIKANADVNVRDAEGDTPLIVSAACGHMEIVSSLIRAGAEVNLSNKNDDTPIILAAHWGQTKFVQECLKPRNNGSKTSQELIKANIKSPNRYSQIVRDLIKAKADVNSHNKDSKTPLISAAQVGHVDSVQILIKSNASVNAQSEDGNTPLIIAVLNEHMNVVEELIEADANPDIQNKNADTALIIAARNGNHEIASHLSNRKIE